jgi:lipopolysaccharide transport system ATP-binding protein
MGLAAHVITETAGHTGAPVISVSDLSKKYGRELRQSLWYGLCDIAREFSRHRGELHAAELRAADFWALREVSFSLDRRESLAVIGANGAERARCSECFMD